MAKKVFYLFALVILSGTAVARPLNPRGPAGGPGYGNHWGDNDNNPPGRLGGRGTNWENPRGPVGGPGYGARWGDNDKNPPGRRGGRGTNWENPRGRRGGPGASPNRYTWCR